MSPGEEELPVGWRDKLDRFSTWRTELTAEAIVLPQTLAELRETIGDLRRVSARLEGATEGIEVLLRRAESSGLAPLARQLDAAATEVENQLQSMQSQFPGGPLVTQAVDDLHRTFEAFTSLVPKSKPKPEGPSG
jgi:UDP-N-acetylenolpyruvoylglucosamine reductase